MWRNNIGYGLKRIKSRSRGAMEGVLNLSLSRIWRWYTEENLHGLTTEHLANGIDLDGLSHIAQHNRVDIATFYHPNLYSLDLKTKRYIFKKYIQSRYDCQ